MPVTRATAITRLGGTRCHCFTAYRLIEHASAIARRSFFFAMYRTAASRFGIEALSFLFLMPVKQREYFCSQPRSPVKKKNAIAHLVDDRSFDRSSAMLPHSVRQLPLGDLFSRFRKSTGTFVAIARAGAALRKKERKKVRGGALQRVPPCCRANLFSVRCRRHTFR